MKILDLFCGAGGAAMGYHNAGFEVVGVDIVDQPNYPFEFWQRDAVEILRLGRYDWMFDAIHASPPCQAYSKAWKINGREHPDLIPEVRCLLARIEMPYIIENVEGAPLVNPVTLCGYMFGLRLYRHRLFEASWPLGQPEHLPHIFPQTKMGRPPKEGEFMQVVGHFSGVKQAREAMETPWMTRDEMAEAIPPAYTEFVGNQLMAHLKDRDETLEIAA